MGTHYGSKAFVIADSDTGELISDKVYISSKVAETAIKKGNTSFSRNPIVVPITPELILRTIKG